MQKLFVAILLGSAILIEAKSITKRQTEEDEDPAPLTTPASKVCLQLLALLFLALKLTVEEVFLIFTMPLFHDVEVSFAFLF